MKSIVPRIAAHTLLITLLFCTSGCINYTQVSQAEFPQGEEQELRPEIAFHNIRSARVYDEFMTLGIFDALWLSDETRTAFVDLFTRKRGRDERFHDSLLRRELDENSLHVSFFLLADVRGEEHTELDDVDAIWSMYLEAPSGEKVVPASIKKIDVSPEMQSFFSFRFTRYKTPYEVKFPIKNIVGNHYLDNSGPFKLVLASVDRRIEMLWGDHPEVADDVKKKYVRVRKQKDDPAEAAKRKDEDFYWL